MKKRINNLLKLFQIIAILIENSEASFYFHTALRIQIS